MSTAVSLARWLTLNPENGTMANQRGWSLYVRGWKRQAVQRMYPRSTEGWERAKAFEAETGTKPGDPL
jgi:hypothetical protein